MIGTRGIVAVGLAAALTLTAHTLTPVTGAQAQTVSQETAQGMAQETTKATEYPDLARLCARVPLLIQRTERIQRRLDGDERTRGSLARLSMRIEKAEDRGNPDLAAYLKNRWELRKQRAAIMPEQLELLQRARATCDEAGS